MKYFHGLFVIVENLNVLFEIKTKINMQALWKKARKVTWEQFFVKSDIYNLHWPVLASYHSEIVILYRYTSLLQNTFFTKSIVIFKVNGSRFDKSINRIINISADWKYCNIPWLVNFKIWIDNWRKVLTKEKEKLKKRVRRMEWYQKSKEVK